MTSALVHNTEHFPPFGVIQIHPYLFQSGCPYYISIQKTLTTQPNLICHSLFSSSVKKFSPKEEKMVIPKDTDGTEKLHFKAMRNQGY